MDMSNPSVLRSQQKGVDAGNAGPLQEFCGHPIVPAGVKQTAETAYVGLVELLGLSGVNNPDLTGVE